MQNKHSFYSGDLDVLCSTTLISAGFNAMHLWRGRFELKHFGYLLDSVADYSAGAAWSVCDVTGMTCPKNVVFRPLAGIAKSETPKALIIAKTVDLAYWKKFTAAARLNGANIAIMSAVAYAASCGGGGGQAAYESLLDRSESMIIFEH